MKAPKSARIERDSLGEMSVPADHYYGSQTARARRNFTVSGYPFSPTIITAVLQIKLAAARANATTGKLEERLARAIEQAVTEALTGKYDADLALDAIQGGATTSVNMNVNEVLANRANEILGGERGSYTPIHPNDHVNMSQSTNDVMPTALRLACLRWLQTLSQALTRLTQSLERQAKKTKKIRKLARTHLQDAVPMYVGEEFGSWAVMCDAHQQPLERIQADLYTIALGGTAIGNKINASDAYIDAVVHELAAITGYPLTSGANLFALTAGMGIFSRLSGELNALAVDLSKIANDIRLLAGGPMGGLDEFILPELQPGSSIMPGKVNPVIPELLNQLCFAVMGNHTTITLATQSGQLELNVFGSIVMSRLEESCRFLTGGMDTFAHDCIEGIRINEAACIRHLHVSTAYATKLSQYIGYPRASNLAHESVVTGRSFYEVVKAAQVVEPAILEEIFAA